MILSNGIVLYHASYTIVKSVDLSLCAAGKDFGKGFYLAADFAQTRRFVRTAIGKAVKNGIVGSATHTGYISEFVYKELPGISCFEFPNASREWLHCLPRF